MIDSPLFLAETHKLVTKALFSNNKQLHTVRPETWVEKPQAHMMYDDVHTIATRSTGETWLYLFGPQEQHPYLLGVGWNSGLEQKTAEMRLVVARDRLVHFQDEHIFDTEQFTIHDEYPVIYIPTKKWVTNEKSAAYYRLLFDSVTQSQDQLGWKVYMESPISTDFEQNAITRALETKGSL